MTNLEHLRNINDTLVLAHEICDVIEAYAGEDYDGCDICPMKIDCSEGNNAIQAYLMRERE